MFKRFKKPANTPEMSDGVDKAPSIPDGEICVSCPSCKKAIFCADLDAKLGVCPKCGHNNRIAARTRIKMLTDENSFSELFTNLTSRNIIDFPDYDAKIQKALKTSGETESVICGTAAICNMPVALFVMESAFMMGSMGAVCGEKITLLFEHATKHKLPVIGYTVSGGARMQEGIISLMQMAKTSAAVKKHSEGGGLYITVLTDPTTGGVTASFAMLGDIILAEPNALIGFAGPRVIEQTIRQKLPSGFQRAEFLLEKGFVDKVVPRAEQKSIICNILKMSQNCGGGFEDFNFECNPVFVTDSANLTDFNENSSKDLKDNKDKDSKDKNSKDKDKDAKDKDAKDNKKPLTPYEKVLAARKPKRTSGMDYIGGIFDGFIEFHGDRRFGDDKAIVGGMAWLNGRAVTVIAQEKGRDTKEKVSRNFGCAHPEGYRKALRLMKLAEKLNLPIVCFIDTSGAYCGIGAEERGQGGAIAENLAEMSALKVPVISILIGEGGSGGALALAVANSVWMLQNAVYSVISPEGCASILWKDDKKAAEAAECLKMTADDLMGLNVIDKILPEIEDKQALFWLFKRELIGELARLQTLNSNELIQSRYNRFRKFI